MEKTLRGFVDSSADQSKVSASLKGLLLLNTGAIVWLLNYFNFPVSVEEVTNLIGIGTALLGALISAFGLARKLVVWFRSRR